MVPVRVQLLAADARARDLCAAAGLSTQPPPADAGALAACDVVVVASPDAVARLAGWRAGGHRLPAIVVLQPGDAPPSDRVLLEPVAVVREPTRAALDDALARLAEGRPATTVGLPIGVADLARLRVTTCDGEVRLSQREADLLAYLAARPGREVGRDELLTEVWGHVKVTATRSVDMAVSRLRKKVERDPAAPVALLTCRGGGYRLEPVVAPLDATPARTDPTARRAPGPPLIGRATLLAAIGERLEVGPVVLVGPPGVGKTRVAREVANRFVLAGGAVVCDLVPADRPEGADAALAAALGVVAARDADSLARSIDAALAQRGPTLIVLDNAEHVVDVVAGHVARWTTGCPAARVLVTSQVPLDVYGEQIVPVEPLADHDARALFAARVRESGGPVPDGASLDALLPLLDGLPLAIELAAARARSLPLDVLRDRLAAHRRLGGRPQRGRSPRHVTLEAAVRWAWELLPADARDALAALAVFVGPFDLDAAVALVGTPEAVDLVAELVDRSLVLREDDRYRLLLAIRGFAREHGAPAVRAAAATRHRQHFAALARREAPRAAGFEARAAIAALVGAMADLDAAWRDAAGSDADQRADLALGLLVALRNRGTLTQRRRIVEESLAHARAVDDDAAIARLSLAAQRLVVQPGRWGRQSADLDEVARRAERARLPDVQIRARLDNILVTHWAGGDADAAGTLAIDLARALRDPVRQAEARALMWAVRCHRDLAATVDAGPPILAGVRALADAGEAADAVRLGVLLSGLARNASDHALAARAFDAIEPLLPFVPDRGLEVRMLELEATRRWHAGDPEAALAVLDEAALRDVGERAHVRPRLARFRAMLQLDAGRPDDAWHTLGAVAAPVAGESESNEGVRAMIEAARGEIDAGLARMEQLHARARPAGSSHTASLQNRELLAWFRHVVGDLDGAEALYALSDLSPVGPHYRAFFLSLRLALALETGADPRPLQAALDDDLDAVDTALAAHLRKARPLLDPSADAAAVRAWRSAHPERPPLQADMLLHLLERVHARR